jgi:hypothetical protein
MNLVDSVLVNNSDPSGPTPDYDHAIDLTGVTGGTYAWQRRPIRFWRFRSSRSLRFWTHRQLCSLVWHSLGLLWPIADASSGVSH